MGGAFDFVGDVIDTGGDILGGVGDVIGDVAGGIGDFAGDILENIDIGDALQAFVLSGGNPYAAAIAATDIDESLGFNPGSFMSGDFSSFGAENIGGGGFDFGVPDFGGDVLGEFGGFDYSNLGNLGENLGDIVNYTDLVNQGGGDFMDYLQTGVDQGGDFTDYLSTLEDFNKLPDIVNQGGDFTDYLSTLEDFNNLPDVPKGIGDVVQGGLDDAINIYKKYGKPAASIAKLITSYEAGKLSKKQQEELNRKIQAEFDAYNAKKSGFAGQIASGSLPQLNISRGNYSPVVGYNPVYAKGGSVRKKYGIGGIADILAGLNLPSLEEISGTYEKYKDPASDIFKLFTSYKAKELAEKQQKELNRKMQESYDKYNKDKSEFSNLISSGNLPKLNITKGSTPTVRMANGGIMGVIR
jgi:hypothetical protein